jgi:hypothetical protein
MCGMINFKSRKNLKIISASKSKTFKWRKNLPLNNSYLAKAKHQNGAKMI